MIIWGGTNQNGYLNTGGKYDPSTDKWVPISVRDAPVARFGHTSIWTGKYMIVWGGYGRNGVSLRGGGKYDSSTDRWTLLPDMTIPSGQVLHTAIWTDTQMIVWGGTSGKNLINTGNKYTPVYE